MTYRVVIPAAGQGKRMGAGKNKLLLLLNDRPVIAHTLAVFQQDENCLDIVLVVHASEIDVFEQLVKTYYLSKVKHIIIGGEERQDSVYRGLSILEDDNSIVIIHDGARPFITKQLVGHVVTAAMNDEAAVLAVPVKDTIKRVADGHVIETMARSSLWAVQTPQAFRLSLIINAYQEGYVNNITATDDASLVEQMGRTVTIVEGDYRNIKITTPEDLVIAEQLITSGGNRT